jgi:hypothetical protein
LFFFFFNENAVIIRLRRVKHEAGLEKVLFLFCLYFKEMDVTNAKKLMIVEEKKAEE